MPPGPYAQPQSLASLDPREPHRAIAALLLRLDLVSVVVTGDQPAAPASSASGGPLADDRDGYDPAVHQQPNPTAAPTRRHAC